MNTSKLILAAASLVFASALTAQAQNYRSEAAPRYSSYAAQAGDWEITLGGGGNADKNFDSSDGVVNFSVGKYLTDMWELSLRQSASYTDTDDTNSDWNFATFGALDYHFGTSNVRPFLGVNFGGYYGDNTNETFAAGLEGGAKFYLREKTFLFALVNYSWLFDKGSEADNNFDDGRFGWNVGIGFNF